VKADLSFELRKTLPDFVMLEKFADGTVRRGDDPKDEDVRTGEAIFIRRSLGVIESGGFRTYTEDDESAKEHIEDLTGNFQFVTFKSADEVYCVGNIHGIWFAGPKSDTPKRLEQSQRLKKFLEETAGKKIMCGDFNLAPSTESIGMLGRDARDLIKEYKIKTTRSRYYEDMEKYADYIADYAFVSGDVHVRDFAVLPEEVSDHLPLSLEFN
jgi:hypothetical protein